MAASQARYLALTARKSNVEFQGQQINQQRTLLATESADLFNQILAMKVPTTPNVSDYYIDTYSFEDGDDKYSFSDPAQNGDGTYKLRLTYDVDAVEAQRTGQYTNATIDASNKLEYNGYSCQLSVADIEDSDDDPAVMTRKILSQMDPSITPGSTVYKYYINDEAGTIEYYISQQTYDNIKSSGNFRALYGKGTTIEQTGSANAYLSTDGSTSGRYTSATIINSTVGDLDGLTFNLKYSSVEDTEAYNQAMLDYEHSRDVYTKKIEDINAKTETIQIQDKTLELKLRQLDTEQNSIQTELESVKKVIQETTERVFKTFQS